MSQRLTAPGWETAGTWTYSALGAGRSNAYGARTGDYVALLLIGRPFLGIDPVTGQPLYGPWYAGSTRQDHAVTLGAVIHDEVWAKRNSGTGGRLELRAYNPATETATVLDSVTEATDWTRLSGKATAEGTDYAIEIALVNTDNETSSWLVDDGFSGEQGDPEMALLGGERPVAAMLNTLQSNLDAHLAEILSERGGSLTLPSPDVWDSVERTTDKADGVQVEVWLGEMRFPMPERDVSTWMPGADGSRLVTASAPIFVRVRHANRDGLSRLDMQRRSQRYGAAVLRVVRDSPTLGGEVDWCTPERIDVSTDADGREIVTDVVTVEFMVHYQETDANEGSAGGGVPASYTA